MANTAGQAFALQLPENVSEFYQEKARMESRDLMEVLQVALQEHMDLLQQQSHQPAPGNPTLTGGYDTIETPAVPY